MRLQLEDFGGADNTSVSESVVDEKKTVAAEDAGGGDSDRESDDAHGVCVDECDNDSHFMTTFSRIFQRWSSKTTSVLRTVLATSLRPCCDTFLRLVR